MLLQARNHQRSPETPRSWERPGTHSPSCPRKEPAWGHSHLRPPASQAVDRRCFGCQSYSACGTWLGLCQQTIQLPPKLALARVLKCRAALQPSPNTVTVQLCLAGNTYLSFLLKTCLDLLLDQCSKPKGLHLVISHDNTFPFFKGRVMFGPPRAAMLC